MTIRLVKTTKYNGRYVALSSEKGRKVIASGKSPAKVFENAVKQGIAKPLIFYVPKKGRSSYGRTT